MGNTGFNVTDIPVSLTDLVQTVGADGFPVVVGTDNTASAERGIWLVHCLNVSCSSSEKNHVYSVGHSFLAKPSLAIDSRGFPIIVFDDINLSVIACLNASCSSHSGQNLVTQVTLSATGVRPNSVAIGTDGFPLITYVLNTGVPKVAHCTSVDCLTGSPLVSGIGPLGGPFIAGRVDTSVAIGVDGLAMIAFGGSTLILAHCDSVNCASSSTPVGCTSDCLGGPNSVDSVAVTIGADGMPLIGYRSGTADREARLTHCTQAQCATSTVSTVEGAGGVDLGGYSWVTLGANGHALMTYRDATHSLLRAAYCTDLACSTFTVTTIDTIASEFGGVVTGVDGLPLVVAGNSTTHQVKAFHCSNIFCLPNVRNR